MMKSSKILAGYFLFFLIVYLVAMLLFLTGCGAIKKAQEQHQEKKANQFFDAHPVKDAERCHAHFPLNDSIGDMHLDSILKANNIDYTNSIDDILQTIDSLEKDSINRYWIMALDSSTTEQGEAFRKILLSRQNKYAQLRDSVQKLRNAYKPCEPEKLYYTSEHWYIDPMLQTINDALQKQISDAAKKNDALQRELKNAQSTNKIRFWMLIAAGAIILLLILLLYNTVRLKHKLTIPHL